MVGYFKSISNTITSFAEDKIGARALRITHILEKFFLMQKYIQNHATSLK